MAHAYSVVYYPEKQRIESSTFEPAIGNETLTACVVRLRDGSGAIVSACNNVPATNFIPDAERDPYAWFDFDPVALGLAEPTPASGQATYTLTFKVTDSNGLRHNSIISLTLKPDGS